MNKSTMLRYYNKYSVANKYIIGFAYDNKVYMVTIDNIKPCYLKTEKASRNQGKNLRLRLKASQKERLIKKATFLCDIDKLYDNKYNKGEIFEKLVTEYFNQIWHKDNIPFYKSGDITIGENVIQIKYENATLTNIKQIKRLLRKFP